MNIYNHSAQKIKSIRQKRGLSQKQLAACTDISLYRLNKIEKGLKCLNVVDLILISEALDIETQEVLEGYEF